jgi:3-hydroxyacyl-[acyl-carrier-protein] dehydratase
MTQPLPVFPFTLDRQAIEQLLPHRGPIFACKQLIAHGPRAYTALSSERIGVLASVRRCAFKRPVQPEHDVTFEITCRQIGADAVQVNAQALVDGIEVAQLETLMVYADKAQFSAAMGWSV